MQAALLKSLILQHLGLFEEQMVADDRRWIEVGQRLQKHSSLPMEVSSSSDLMLQPIRESLKFMKCERY